MTATRSRLDPKVEAAEVNQELPGSEFDSTDKYTPGGIAEAISTAARESGPGFSSTYDGMIRILTEDYIREELTESPDLHPDTIASELVTKINNMIEVVNVGRHKKNQFPYLRSLTPPCVARLIVALERVAVIRQPGSAEAEQGDSSAMGESGGDTLGVYVDDPSDSKYGLYSFSRKHLKPLALKYCDDLSTAGVTEVMSRVEAMAPALERSSDPNLVPVYNGVFDRRSWSLVPFSPEMVFTTKSPVSHRENPISPRIVDEYDNDGYVFEFEEWLASLSDDPQIVNLFWELFSFSLRPDHRTDKSVWLYSESGNNGKGTLFSVTSSLVGSYNVGNLSVAAMGNKFQQPMVVGKSIIIGDENPVGTYCDDVSFLKSYITNDPVLIEPKFGRPFPYQPRGLVVQSLNEFLRIRDRSASFLRRILAVPMTKCFTGVEKRHIKKDYLRRPEVLEYVLHKALHLDVDAFTVPDACAALLEEFKLHNDSVGAFWDSIKDQLAGLDLLPTKLLYDVYRAIEKDENESGRVMSLKQFAQELRAVVRDNPEWVDKTARTDTAISVKLAMQATPQVLRDMAHKLPEWFTQDVQGHVVKTVLKPKTARMRGLVRRSYWDSTVAANGDEEAAYWSRVASRTITAVDDDESVVEESVA